MVSEDATEYRFRDGRRRSASDGLMASFEDVMTRSDSLSLSSYSSWLLPPPPLVARYPVPMTNWPVLRARRLLLCTLESCCTLRPVVMISSAAEESDDDDGLESISTHDSSDCCCDDIDRKGAGVCGGDVMFELSACPGSLPRRGFWFSISLFWR